MSYLIRAIQNSDWPAIDAMQYRVFDPSLHEDLSVLQSKWRASPSTCFVAEDKHQALVAYLLTHPWDENSPPELNAEIPTKRAKNLFIHDLSVDTSAQGQGLGKLMFNHLVKVCEVSQFEEIRLVAVQGSQPFWNRFGFNVVAELSPAKGYGNDAVLMAKQV